MSDDNEWLFEGLPKFEPTGKLIQLTLHGIDDKPPSRMTIGQAASYLGLSIKVVRQNVPCRTTRGGHRRFIKSDLDRWLEIQQVKVVK